MPSPLSGISIQLLNAWLPTDMAAILKWSSDRACLYSLYLYIYIYIYIYLSLSHSPSIYICMCVKHEYYYPFWLCAYGLQISVKGFIILCVFLFLWLKIFQTSALHLLVTPEVPCAARTRRETSSVTVSLAGLEPGVRKVMSSHHYGQPQRSCELFDAVCWSLEQGKFLHCHSHSHPACVTSAPGDHQCDFGSNRQHIFSLLFKNSKWVWLYDIVYIYCLVSLVIKTPCLCNISACCCCLHY